MILLHEDDSTVSPTFALMLDGLYVKPTVLGSPPTTILCVCGVGEYQAEFAAIVDDVVEVGGSREFWLVD